MNLIMDFLGTYGSEIIITFFGIVGTFILKTIQGIYDKKVTDETKIRLAKITVEAIEQLYKEFNGEEKLEVAIEQLDALFNKKGIDIDEVEVRLLIESQVAELKNIFTKEGAVE